MVLPALIITTAAVAASGYATFVPTSRIWGAMISRATTSAPRIALTFDDGPTAGATDRILDTLAELKVPATFFVIGANAEREPALMRRIHADGHLLANHSYHHAHYAMFRGPRYWSEEIARTDALIEQVTGKAPAFFRPPMGIKTPIILRAASATGHRTVAWTHRAHDGFPTTPQRIVQRLTTNVTPGSILLLHDGVEPNHPRNPECSVASVRPLIESLRAQDFDFLRLDDLLNLPA